MRSLPLLALGMALLAGCTSPQAPAGVAPQESAAAGVEIVPADAAPVGGPYEFTTAILEGGIFQHARLDAATQATIHWWNVDSATHSVVSDDGRFAGSGPIPPGGEFSVTFLTPGDYAYHCRYHPAMTGVVVVR